MSELQQRAWTRLTLGLTKYSFSITQHRDGEYCIKPVGADSDGSETFSSLLFQKMHCSSKVLTESIGLRTKLEAKCYNQSRMPTGARLRLYDR